MDDEKIKSIMEEGRKFAPPGEYREKAHVKSMEEYEDAYERFYG